MRKVNIFLANSYLCAEKNEDFPLLSKHDLFHKIPTLKNFKAIINNTPITYFNTPETKDPPEIIRVVKCISKNTKFYMEKFPFSTLKTLISIDNINSKKTTTSLNTLHKNLKLLEKYSQEAARYTNEKEYNNGYEIYQHVETLFIQNITEISNILQESPTYGKYSSSYIWYIRHDGKDSPVHLRVKGEKVYDSLWRQLSHSDRRHITLSNHIFYMSSLLNMIYEGYSEYRRLDPKINPPTYIGEDGKIVEKKHRGVVQIIIPLENCE